MSPAQPATQPMQQQQFSQQQIQQQQLQQQSRPASEKPRMTDAELRRWIEAYEPDHLW